MKVSIYDPVKKAFREAEIEKEDLELYIKSAEKVKARIAETEAKDNE